MNCLCQQPEPSDEWIQISKTEPSSVFLNGWKIDDEGNKYTIHSCLTSWMLETVTVLTRKSTDPATEPYWQLDGSILNNDEDSIPL
jgi:hypothetical protein